LPDNMAMKNELFYRYKKGATERELPFSLDFQVFVEKTQQPCFYCGVKSSATMWSTFKNRRFDYNGIDRIDSSKGYIEGNIVTSCHQCNFAKSDYTLDEFYTWVERVANKRKEAA
jgi:hypothetical protein